MKKRLLIMSTELSGINKFLFKALENLGWELIVEDIPIPSLCRWLSILISFNINMRQWKKQTEINYIKVCKMAWVFKERTKYAQKAIKKYSGKYDMIFQISSMFAPLPNEKYLLWIDYTTVLSKSYPGWAPFKFELKKRLSLEKQVYGNAQLIFTTSEITRKSLINYYGVAPEKVVKTGYGLNLDEVKVFDKKYDGKTKSFFSMRRMVMARMI
jgi:hypothetical protein